MEASLREIIDQGVARHRAGDLATAERIYRQVLQQNPRTPGVIQLMGLLCHQSGRNDEAAALIRQAIAIGGPVPQYHYNLGNVLRSAGDLDGAARAFEDAVKLKPDYVEAIDNLAGVLISQSLHDDALRLSEKSLTLRPGAREALVNQARVYHDLGMISQARESLGRALEADPGYAVVHSNLVYLLYLDPRSSPEQVTAEHRRYAERQCAPFAPEIRPHLNDRDPQRKLRLAYLSGDLRSHPVGRFMEPVLREHDRDQFQIVCYADDSTVDDVTKSLMPLADEWHVTAGMPDSAVAEMIRADRIDILIDLAGHTTGNRLPVFARKPAPVQVSYLGQTTTTGLPTMDYLITTPVIHPPELDGTYHTEELVRVTSLSCWQAPENSPEPDDSPAASAGAVTFLSTNNPGKINDVVLQTWSQLLQVVAGSRLLLRVALGQSNIAFARRLAEAGIPADRFELVAPAPRESFLDIHHRADISLDPFPYNGYTTTHESLWMGVPVVTLAGRSPGPGRYGASLLGAVGLDELIADSPRRYVEIATMLAQDRSKLATLRSELRSRLSGSSLMNATQVTRDLEAAFRRMWRRWCESGTRPERTVS